VVFIFRKEERWWFFLVLFISPFRGAIPYAHNPPLCMHCELAFFGRLLFSLFNFGPGGQITGTHLLRVDLVSLIGFGRVREGFFFPSDLGKTLNMFPPFFPLLLKMLLFPCSSRAVHPSFSEIFAL